MTNLLCYDMGFGVEAFTTKKDSMLPYHVIQPHQVHSDKIAVVTDRDTKREQLEGIDAVITNLEECAIGVRTADCVPVLLYDVEQRVVAAIHSGWRGTTMRILQKSIEVMRSEFGTNPLNLSAVIGPSIGQESFAVHDDVVGAFVAGGFPMDDICIKYSCNQYKIDLWKANEYLLIEAGVEPNNIHIAGICTYINHNDYYSARYEKNNKCGRNINTIKLKSIC